MSYVTKVLQPGETILGTAYLHWFIYLRAIVAMIAAVACVAGSQFLPPDQARYLLLAAIVLLAIGLLLWLISAVRRHSTELAVTDHRVIYKTGLLSRHTIEMNRNKVESVDVVQTIPGRLFNYGTIVVRGTGGSLEPIRNIGDPLSFRSFITAA